LKRLVKKPTPSFSCGRPWSLRSLKLADKAMRHVGLLAYLLAFNSYRLIAIDELQNIGS
jgi:hypothetical protein